MQRKTNLTLPKCTKEVVAFRLTQYNTMTLLLHERHILVLYIGLPNYDAIIDLPFWFLKAS